MSTLLNFICIFWFVSVLLEKLITKIFLSRLRRLHTATWIHLGEPAVLMTTFKFLGFLWRKDFNLLPDEKIVVVGRAARFFWLCEAVLWVLMAVFVVELSWRDSALIHFAGQMVNHLRADMQH